jgi:DNA-binding HxlR family transcriptional regulator
MDQKGAEEEEEEEQKCKAINNMWVVLGRRWALLI